MATKAELMAVGMPASQANRLGYDTFTAVTSAGSTQLTATVAAGNASKVTCAIGGSGMRLNSSEQQGLVYNIGPQVLTVYPIVGGTINGLAINAGIQLAAGKSATLFADGLNTIANISA